MTTALDIITRSLRTIGAYAPGESISSADANDALDMLNDMVDTWSNATMMIPYVTEIIFTIQNGKYQYTLGPGGSIGGSFTGSIAPNTNGTGILTVTSIPLGNIALGQYIGGASSGTQITGFITGAGGIGTYEVNNSQTVVSGALTTYYQRPLRINSAFVRMSNLDYPVYPLNLENYEQIGLKTLSGPWPRALYYQPSSPLGNVTLWPVPAAGEMHMFAETVLSQFSSLQDDVTLPQGYNMALRWNLAEFLLAEYGRTTDPVLVQLIIKKAKESKAWIKRTNMQPPAASSFDMALLDFRHGNDPSWILSGGFLP
jgi:hypothetical protein